jgi:hypothetical protein
MLSDVSAAATKFLTIRRVAPQGKSREFESALGLSAGRNATRRVPTVDSVQHIFSGQNFANWQRPRHAFGPANFQVSLVAILNRAASTLATVAGQSFCHPTCRGLLMTLAHDFR